MQPEERIEMITWAIVYATVKLKAEQTGIHLMAAMLADVMICLFITLAIADR
jgi:hypothetical protein